MVENLDLHVDKQKQHRKQDYKVNPLLDHIKRDEKKKTSLNFKTTSRVYSISINKKWQQGVQVLQTMLQ